MRKGIFYDLSDYTITENGDVINKHNNRHVKPRANNKGYLRVSICGKMYFVHRLVAQTYIPNPDNKSQVNHKDGNKLNNNVSNLEWVSNSENKKHAIDHGLIPKGEECSWAKLSREDVMYIRNRTNESISELAQKFNVSRNTIQDVIHYRCWKD